MLVSNKIIYLELHKTGSTYIRQILKKCSDLNDVKTIGVHNDLKSVDTAALGDISQKILLGSIRNPWDWYVSLWAYGCMKMGGFYTDLGLNRSLATKKGISSIIKNPKIIFRDISPWQEVYSNAEDPLLFKKWLDYVLKSKRHHVGEQFNRWIGGENIGFYTYRFLKLYTDIKPLDFQLIKNDNDVMDYVDKHEIIKVYIRSEHIITDLVAKSPVLGITEESVLDAVEKLKTNKPNSSKRTKYQDYYDQESIDLVAQREHFIINKFSYTF